MTCLDPAETHPISLDNEVCDEADHDALGAKSELLVRVVPLKRKVLAMAEKDAGEFLRNKQEVQTVTCQEANIDELCKGVNTKTDKERQCLEDWLAGGDWAAVRGALLSPGVALRAQAQALLTSQVKEAMTACHEWAKGCEGGKSWKAELQPNTKFTAVVAAATPHLTQSYAQKIGVLLGQLDKAC